jgi:hypothetical protein
MEMLVLTNEEETGNARAHEEDDKSRVDVISTAQNAEKMVMETPCDDSTFRHQNDLGVRVSEQKGINRDQMMMRKHRKEHFFHRSRG